MSKFRSPAAISPQVSSKISEAQNFAQISEAQNFAQILEAQHFFNFWAKNHKNWIIKIFTRIPTLSGILVVRFGGQLSSPTRVQNDDQKSHSTCRFWSKKVSKNDQAKFIQKSRENPFQIFERILKSQNLRKFWKLRILLKFWKFNIFSIFEQKITKIELSRFLQESRQYLAF